MSSAPKPYIHPSSAGNAWFPAGLTSSYPNVTDTALSDLLPCQNNQMPGCKIFHLPTNDSSKATEVKVEDVSVKELSDQVVVFQFGGRFYAIDHRCPHSSYPLSNGIPFEIEDFGIKLSAGIRCPKHDWSFDLVRGNGDRWNHRLKIWEVQVRPKKVDVGEEEVGEVWVRRKQRMG